MSGKVLRGVCSSVLHKGLLIIGALVALQFVTGCDYARMREDEAFQTYQEKLPQMTKRSIPITGGAEILKASNPDSLKNPIAYSDESVKLGQERYGYYCIQCHGPQADGHATVGQSFAPLPTDLRGSYVQEQSDGMLFYKISLGFQRHPHLIDTVSEEGRWTVINFIRSLGKQSKERG